MNFLKLVLFFVLLTLFSCKKSKDIVVPTPELITTDIKNGFPNNLSEINGYFCAEVQSYNSNYYSLMAYAVFNDPGQNLMATYNHLTNNVVFNGSGIGNVSVGSVKLSNTYFLNTNSSFGSNTIFYNMTGSSSSSSNLYTPTWNTTGNKSFKPIDISLPRGFPVITSTLTSNYTLSISNGFSVNIAPMFSNFDSLIVSFNTNFSSPVRKSVSSSATSISFSNAELSFLSTYSNTTLTFIACNYSNKTIENKVYVFESVSRLDNNVYIYP